MTMIPSLTTPDATASATTEPSPAGHIPLDAETPPASTPSAKASPPKCEEFSSPHEFLGAQYAMGETNLVAREVFRPASESECGCDVFPRDARMRCQLGTMRKEKPRTVPALEGVRRAFSEDVTVFKLQAYGRNWAEAIAMAIRLEVVKPKGDK